MDFKQLRNEVQLLRDELAIMKRKYEDILYNLDDDNFSGQFLKEKDNMKTEIKIAADGIKTKVSKEDLDKSLSQYSTLEQTAEAIRTEVAALSETDGELYSQISQTASSIKSVVSKNISVKFEKSVKPTKSNTTDAEKGILCEYNGTLYYYNDITETWKEYPYADGIMSQFLQTPSGFEMTGDVSISGDAIVGGTISGSKLKGGSFVNSAGSVILTLGGDISSDMGDMTLSTDDGRQVFQVYDNASITDFNVKDSCFLSSTGLTTYVYGTWSFEKANVVGLSGGSGGTPYAVFG
jgi:hypothetical protein